MGASFKLNCPSCGDHVLSSSADAVLAGPIYNQGLARARIAHGVCKLPAGSVISTQTLDSLASNGAIPEPIEYVDRAVIWLAEKSRPGEPITFSAQIHRAVIGATSAQGAAWAMKQAVAAQFIAGAMNPTEEWMDATLTAKGWNHYAALMRDGAGSRHAFMAMKFGVAEMDAVYRDHIKPAVLQAGFELRRTDESHKSAGLIDNRMRVEIRTSRFLICDLSHGNQGAYWEAGFAEGLGRPVIYTCSREAFDNVDPSRRPHFDTAHQSIVVWDPANPATAMQELKDMIRATLPGEAQLEDG
jgi:hypothetical protein